MTEKFELYDLLAILVPGSLTVGAACALFPKVATLSSVKLPDAFAVVVLVSLAVFTGQIIQALASLTEPLLEKSWGGRASEQAFMQGLGDRYLPHATATRVRQHLVTSLGREDSDRSLFIFAMGVAESTVGSRASRFNGLYAYHRALCSMVALAWVISLLSIVMGAASGWPLSYKFAAAFGGPLLFALVWYRTKQRGFYYVREVLLTAERVLREKPQVGVAK